MQEGGVGGLARRASGLLKRAADAIRPALARVGLDLKWPQAPGAPPEGFGELTAFGANPGDLRMLLHVPVTAQRGAALIVLLHGCEQDAVRFAQDSGFLALTGRLGALLLLPTQVQENNRQRCFNWFRPADTARECGEAASIRAMVASTLALHECDPSRVFVAGLSAGGAMAAVCLAAYPDVFAAGAVAAGLPVGCASSAAAAMHRMSQGGPPLSPEEWARRVRQIGPLGFAGPWPRISIWQGMADRLVNPANAFSLVAQWTALHGKESATEDNLRPRLRHRRWGRAVELWELADMDHAFPVGRDLPGRFIANVHVNAAAEMARFWGLG
jgi:poly(hydroxyalkanoate) depolymerase family esterase